MSLARVRSATRCRIVAVRGGHRLPYRLMEMGLVEGAQVEVVRRAPLGDPLQVRLGDYELALRESDAELIDVTEI